MPHIVIKSFNFAAVLCYYDYHYIQFHQSIPFTSNMDKKENIAKDPLWSGISEATMGTT